MKNNIWSYWEAKNGSCRPEYLDLCEETWQRHCGDDFVIRRLGPEDVSTYAPNLCARWKDIPVLAHKADYLRAVLVYEHGGIWLDNDVIVLKNLREMMEAMERRGVDFIGCGRPGNKPSIGIFGGSKGCQLLDAYIRKMNELIRSRGDGALKFRWTELGYGLLWPLTRNYPYFQYEFRICIPVHPSRFRTFFEATDLADVSRDDCDIRDDTLAVCLYNAMFPVAFKKKSKDMILNEKSVISQIYRMALGNVG